MSPTPCTFLEYQRSLTQLATPEARSAALMPITLRILEERA